MRHPTVVVAIHDGHYGASTGAGLANRAFVHALIANLAPAVRLVVLPVYLCPSSSEHDATWHEETLRILTGAQATVLPVDNGTGGTRRFGGLREFRALAITTAATLANAIVPTADPLAVLLFDVPFFGVPPLVPIDGLPHITLVPRSTALLHDPTNIDRVRFEQHGMHKVARHGGRIAAISAHMRDHLLNAYHLPKGRFVSLDDGLTEADWQFDPPDPALLPAAATGGFLLAMGRAQPYKGWDDLIDALVIARSHRERIPHAVLAAVTEDPKPSDYQRHLAQRIRETRLDATLLTRFSPKIRDLLAHPALRGVIVASRVEPFGRIPLEAYAAGAAPVITTTAGGLAAQAINAVTAITSQPHNPPRLAEAIRRAVALTTTERTHMRRASRQFASEHFNHTLATRRFLVHAAPWALGAPDPNS